MRKTFIWQKKTHLTNANTYRRGEPVWKDCFLAKTESTFCLHVYFIIIIFDCYHKINHHMQCSVDREIFNYYSKSVTYFSPYITHLFYNYTIYMHIFRLLAFKREKKQRQILYNHHFKKFKRGSSSLCLQKWDVVVQKYRKGNVNNIILDINLNTEWVPHSCNVTIVYTSYSKELRRILVSQWYMSIKHGLAR